MALGVAGRLADPELPDLRSRIKMFEMVAMATIVAVVAGIVLYPIFYLLQASFDVGLPDVRPPSAYGTANFAKVFDYPHIIWNTLVVTFASTVMALLFGWRPGFSRARTCHSSAPSIS